MRKKPEFKTCTKCGQKFKNNNSNFYVRGYYKETPILNSWCAACSKEKNKNWLNKNPTYKSVRKARSRCRNKNDAAYKNYGARGIEFRFSVWTEILKEIGPRPENKTLDRINTNGHYESGNIKWSTRTEQCRNRRCTKLSMDDVQQIKKLSKSGNPSRIIASLYGVSHVLICQILRNEIYL